MSFNSRSSVHPLFLLLPCPNVTGLTALGLDLEPQALPFRHGVDGINLLETRISCNHVTWRNNHAAQQTRDMESDVTLVSVSVT